MNNYYLNKLNQIKIALGMDVKMVDAVLKDGVTRVSAETLESGSKIYVVAEDGTKAPAPEGIHELEDGTKVYVDAEGTITEVEKPEQEVEIEIEAAAEEVPAGEKSAEQPTKSEATITKEEMAAYVDGIMEKVMMTIEEVAKEIGSVKEEMASYKSKMEKMSSTPASTKISTFNNEPATPVDAVDARIEGLNNLRAELAKTRKF
jgi:hypothetical protein